MEIDQKALDDFASKIRQQEKNRVQELQKKHAFWDAIIARYYPEYSFRKIGEILGVDSSNLARRYRKTNEKL